MEWFAEARTPEAIETARTLFWEYHATPGVAECVQGFQQEADSLPGRYSILLLAYTGGFPAGCAGVRPLESGACELKRLYVRPAARGRRLSRRLMEEAMRRAAAAGFRHMRLDTLPSMTAAISLYRSLGFREIARYYHGAPENAIFFEADLPAK